jgi:hypothetical protein
MLDNANFNSPILCTWQSCLPSDAQFSYRELYTMYLVDGFMRRLSAISQ